ncbi:MAG: DUF4097 family beta strand repeat protein [Candidatus Thermoplasmatota archaeon]|nr:DUF4097 family beta strand repeat protein [Candidatus Thermoplasmatota archaeon]
MKPRWKAFVILTCAIVLLMAIMAVYIAAMGYFTMDTEEAIETLDFKDGQQLEVTLKDRGDVEVTAWDSDEIKIVGMKRTYFGREQFEKIDLKVEVDENVMISAVRERNNEWVWMDIKVHIPMQMKVSFVRTSTGDIHVRGIYGDTLLECSTGDIMIWDCRGNVSASTDTGDIWVNNQGQEGTGEVPRFGEGNFTFKTDTGDIWIKGIENVIKAQTSTGNIRIYECSMVGPVNADTGDIKVWDCSYATSITSDTGNVDVKVLNVSEAGSVIEVETGDIDITVPMDIDADYEISADTGSVGVDQKLPHEGSGSKNFKMGTINDGGPLIKASSDTGNVYLKGG